MNTKNLNLIYHKGSKPFQTSKKNISKILPEWTFLMWSCFDLNSYCPCDVLSRKQLPKGILDNSRLCNNNGQHQHKEDQTELNTILHFYLQMIRIGR